MANKNDYIISGIEPTEYAKEDVIVFESRLNNAYSQLTGKKKAVDIVYQDKKEVIKPDQEAEYDLEFRSRRFVAIDPKWSMENIILSRQTSDALDVSLNLIRHQKLIFETWGLKSIEPTYKSILNFYGPPGTGKTIAAHAVAGKLNKKILLVSYAEIESKFVGEAPKNLESVFIAAEKGDAVLFIDEADSLLSKRLTNVTQGSEQAINSMRSQLLLILERVTGIVIFSTNLIENYDYAFTGRVKHIFFPMPDKEARKRIWETHLPKSLPVSVDIQTELLAERFSEFSGRDIKNSVIDAAVLAASAGKNTITMEDFNNAAEYVKSSQKHLNGFSYNNSAKLSEEEKEKIKKAAEKGDDYIVIKE